MNQAANYEKEYFVTLFNLAYIYQGLSLFESLSRQYKSAILVVVCVDDETYEILKNIGATNLCPVKLSTLETTDLLSVKRNRTIQEYCWTLTPFSILWTFRLYTDAKRVTYLDADTFFLKSPHSILSNFSQSQKDIFLTEHSYSPEYDQTATSGRFCVQFVTCSNQGLDIVEWWSNKCLEWCYARFENGMFGDQGWITQLYEKFYHRIYLIEDCKLFLAPWNATTIRYSESVVYHFHGFKLLTPNSALIGSYCIPEPVITYIYRPYLARISKLIDYFSLPFFPQASMTPKTRLRILLKRVSFLTSKISSKGIHFINS